MNKKVFTTDENEIEWFINEGFEIIGSAPNPYPQPYVYFVVVSSPSDDRSRKRILELLNIWSEDKGKN